MTASQILKMKMKKKREEKLSAKGKLLRKSNKNRES